MVKEFILCEMDKGYYVVLLAIFVIVFCKSCHLTILKIVDILCACYLCFVLGFMLFNIWNDNSFKLCVQYPSINLMSEYMETFLKEYEGHSIPFDKKQEFFRNMRNKKYDIEITDKSKKLQDLIEKVRPNISNEKYEENREDMPLAIQYISQYIFDEFWGKVISGIIMIVLMINLFVFYRRSIIPKYCSRLEKNINEKKHLWMKENTLQDILISVRIFRENKINSKDLCTYFDKEIQQKGKGIYYILGQPGEGKSVALMRIALMVIEGREKFLSQKKKYFNKVPVLLSIAEITNLSSEDGLERNLLNYILTVATGKENSFYAKYFLKYWKHFFLRYLEQGKWIILLDGYDEVNADMRYIFTKKLQCFYEKYPNCIIVVTSRTYVFEADCYPILKRGERLCLSALTREQIYEFIFKWDFSRAEASQLYRRIIMNSQLEHLAENPFLLTLICYMYKNDAEIEKDNITDFYLEASRCLLKKWEKSKKIQNRVSISLEDKEDALAAFAYFQLKLSGDQSWMSKKEAIKAIEESAKMCGISPSSLLEEICLQSGIIVKNLFDENYGFYHRSFFEFYAALYIVRHNCPIQDIEAELSQYHRLISFYLALKNDIVITRQMLYRHQSEYQFVRQTLRECRINDKNFVLSYVRDTLENIKKMDIAAYHELGELVRYYPYLREYVCPVMWKQFELTKNILEKQNCIVALSYFEDSAKLAKAAIQNFEEKDMIDLIRIANGATDNIIYHLAEEAADIVYLYNVLDGIAAISKYDLLFQLIMKCKDPEVKVFIMGSFLHSTRSHIFYEWLATKEFIKYETNQVAVVIQEMIKKYKWYNNDLSKTTITNIYVIIWYTLQLLDKKEYKFEYQKIDNRIKFVVTYIKNVTSKKDIRNYMIDIPDFKVRSIVEFHYHWKKGGSNYLKELGCNPVFLRYMLIFCIFVANVILSFYYISKTCNAVYLTEIRSRLEYIISTSLFTDCSIFMVNDIRNIQIGNNLFYDGIYISFAFLINVEQILIHKYLVALDFKYYFIIYYILTMLSTIFLYSIIVQEEIFRLVYLMLNIIIMFIGILKHKNNYPSFQLPQYRKIKEFLDE